MAGRRSRWYGKAPHVEARVALERAEILVEEVVEREDAQPCAHGVRLAPTRKPRKERRSSAVIPKRATPAT